MEPISNPNIPLASAVNSKRISWVELEAHDLSQPKHQFFEQIHTAGFFEVLERSSGQKVVYALTQSERGIVASAELIGVATGSGPYDSWRLSACTMGRAGKETGMDLSAEHEEWLSGVLQSLSGAFKALKRSDYNSDLDRGFSDLRAPAKE